MESWYLYVLLSAVILAIGNIIRKHVLNHEHAMEQLAAESPFKILILCFLIPFVGIPTGTHLLYIVLSAGVLYLTLLYRNKSYRHMNISTVAPLQNLSPVILIFFATVFLHEIITPTQLAGIFLIVLGGYALNLKSSDPLNPIKRIFHQKNARTVIIWLVLLSLIATLNRWILYDVGMEVITYLFWMNILVGIISLVMHFEFHKFKGVTQDIKKGWMWLTLLGITGVLNVLLFFIGIAQPAALIAVAIPLRRTATLIEVFFGGKIFHEKGLMRKAVGCSIMLAGVLIIV